MKIELGFLRTKVARTLFLRFVICALLPLGVLATISAHTVSRYLDERSDQRLYDIATGAEKAVSDRLSQAARDLELLADLLSDGRSGEQISKASLFGAPSVGDLGAHFDALGSAAIVGSPASTLETEALFGDPAEPPALDQTQVQHLKSGGTLLVEIGSESYPGLYMARSISEEPDQAGILWSRLDRSHLWQASSELAGLPALSGLAVLNRDLKTLHGPDRNDDVFKMAVQSAVEDRAGPGSAWEDQDGRHRFVTRPIILGPDYRTGDWQIVVSMPEEMVTAPLRDFAAAFLPVMLAAFLVVLLLSDAQIRRTIRPLELIHDATKRIASEDFSGRLDISSKDEFSDLAQSFNTMSDRLGKQIQTLTAISHVDRAALSATDSKEIVDALLHTLLNVVDCETVSVCTLAQTEDEPSTSFAVSRDSREVTIVHAMNDPRDELCPPVEGHLLLSGTDRGTIPCLNVPPFGDHEHERFLILPLELDDRRAGLVCFASTNSEAFPADEVRRLRQIADQATLALSNVDRLDELGRMSLGALTALARTIDASSPWTAGHSERVTRVATMIGQRLGLDAEQLDSLRRGGLLHDIGKIGVPVDILNKPGSLTAEEFDAVKEHVTVGQRILEPIHAYSDLIPIVRHHHERVDGRGYPDGLAGDEIHLLARIVAVADTFDALTSDRPYRQGLPIRTAIEVIRNGAGSQLDERLVDTFLALIEEGCLDFLPGRSDEPAEEEDDEAEYWPVRVRAVSRA